MNETQLQAIEKIVDCDNVDHPRIIRHLIKEYRELSEQNTRISGALKTLSEFKNNATRGMPCCGEPRDLHLGGQCP